MEKFAESYARQNPDVFSNSDTAFILAPYPKPLPLKAFMMEYLGTAPQMSSLSFTFALEMLHKDFKKYMYPHDH
ncbi:unnamed protein product [Cylindrotheca closterium]|uniref:SEC7 domain-containing protein n=1 Tax=Cylindrotheca closterium TaxID=2856 RepID=A0AAD2PV57_9STRA|nr:unnamed protein product [Cylindrotheca closterium]